MSNNIALKSHTTRLKQRWVHISGFVQHISSATANVVCVRLQLSNRLKAELLLKANESETLSAISVHGKATQIQRSLLPCDKLMNHLKTLSKHYFKDQKVLSAALALSLPNRSLGYIIGEFFRAGILKLNWANQDP